MDIGWSVINIQYELFCEKPDNIYHRYMEEIPESIKHCVGMGDYWKNIFCIRSPFDLDLSFQIENNKVIIDNSDDFVLNSFEEQGLPFLINDPKSYGKYPNIQIPLSQIFIADKPCKVELIPPAGDLHLNPMWSFIRFASGEIDIHAWQRPINFAFEWVDITKKIHIKKGEPLMYAKFHSKNINETFKIKELKFDGDIKKLFHRCVTSRELLKKGTRDLINMARRKRDKNVVGKCPYKFDI